MEIPPQIELHATEILSGTNKKRSYNWYGVNYPIKDDRIALLHDACDVMSNLNITLICVVINKLNIKQHVAGYKEMPKNRSWEFLIERMNLFLEFASDKKGMIISDAIEHQIEKNNRLFAQALYAQSTHINNLHFIESILFEPSESSLMLQMADIAAFACHRCFNMNDNSYYATIAPLLFSRNSSPQGVGLKIWPETA